MLMAGLVSTTVLAVWAAIQERRMGIAFVALPYLLLMHINAYVYLEQFVLEIVLKRKNLVWFKPDRFEMSAS
jgi:hypothetical protein